MWREHSKNTIYDHLERHSGLIFWATFASALFILQLSGFGEFNTTL